MNTEKNHIGILGLGARSTLYYLEKLNRLFNKTNGGYSTCPLKLLNTNFNLINPYLPNQFDKLIPVLNNYIVELDNLGISSIVIPNITLHETIDKLQLTKVRRSKIIHPLMVCLTQLKKNQVEEIVLFGSIHTMKKGYVSDYFKKSAIKVHFPNENDNKTIDHFRRLVYSSQEKKQDKFIFLELVKKYSKNIPVILACTELSLYHPLDIKNVYDLSDLQINIALEESLANK